MSLPINQILHGNCIELLKTLPSDSVDLIFADPPYWMRTKNKLHYYDGSEFSGCDDDWDNQFKTTQDYNDFTLAWLSECQRVLKPNGSFWVIGSLQCIYSIGGIMQNLGFWIINDVVWHKTNPTPNFMGTRLNNSHETLIWATKSERAKYTFHYNTAKELNTNNTEATLFAPAEKRQLGSVWKIPLCMGNERLKNESGKKLHSTQKPEALLYNVIAISSNLGDIVLDPFGGSMTTPAVAKRLGRNYIACEQNIEYIKAGQKRIDKVRYEDSKIAKAEYDIKPAKVSITELIENGYLEVGEKLYIKDGFDFAILLPNGKLEYENKVWDIHSLSAKIKNTKAERLNGFRFWEVLRKGKRELLYSLREKYRAKLELS